MFVAFMCEDHFDVSNVCTFKTQNNETITDFIVTAEKSVQVAVKIRETLRYKSKSVYKQYFQKRITTSSFKIPTKSSFTSPFKMEPCLQRPSKSCVVKAFRRNNFVKESDSDASCIINTGGISSMEISDSDNKITKTNIDIEKLQCLKDTIRIIQRKLLMYVC